MLDRNRWTPIVFALLVAACGQASGTGELVSDLPGSAEFPVVAGSRIAPCPASWAYPLSQGGGASYEPVCVAAPNNADGESIVDTYKQLLDKRGFRFGRYLGSPSVVMLVRLQGNDCDLMVFGLPYLPPEQRSDLVLMFKLQQTSAEACLRVEREGRG